MYDAKPLIFGCVFSSVKCHSAHVDPSQLASEGNRSALPSLYASIDPKLGTWPHAFDAARPSDWIHIRDAQNGIGGVRYGGNICG